jgi:hypothetical protein
MVDPLDQWDCVLEWNCRALTTPCKLLRLLPQIGRKHWAQNMIMTSLCRSNSKCGVPDSWDSTPKNLPDPTKLYYVYYRHSLRVAGKSQQFYEMKNLILRRGGVHPEPLQNYNKKINSPRIWAGYYLSVVSLHNWFGQISLKKTLLTDLLQSPSLRDAVMRFRTIS